MCTVRYIGRFVPDDPLEAPWPVVEHLAAQLGIEDPSVVKRYTERPKTAYEHAWEIRDAYEYHEYDDAEWSRRFRTFLHGRAWTHAEGPKALFDHAVGWLRRHRVLLPGVSVLARQVSEARKVADKRLHATVAGAARRADPALPGDLVATLKTPPTFLNFSWLPLGATLATSAPCWGLVWLCITCWTPFDFRNES